MEEDFWKQKAAIRWLKDADKNTKFYQSWVRQKRTRSRIHEVQIGNDKISDDSEIRESAVDFFRDLLAPSLPSLIDPNPDFINRFPASTNLEGLGSSPTSEEVKQAAFDISGDSTPGPDGFTATFFQKCWHIVGPDVSSAICQFFNGAFLPRSMTATMIVLLPKKDNPATWSDYRPISLCNVVNKIITKILSARLSPLLPLVIAPNQSGFVKGRLLNDNVLLAQEMIHELPRCRPSPNVALKLDMAKAYDRIQWPFLIKVMRHMGFPEAWLSLIERCVGSCWFSILVNGSPSGFFKSTRGLRQGDPISPALFVIAADYLSRALDKLILGHKDMVFKSSKTCPEVSHLAYADDFLVFTQAAPTSIRRLKGCLDNYSAVSGQQINISKSNFYIAEEHGRWTDSIELEGGFTRGSFPFIYLGVPIFRGAKKTDLFLFLREKIARKIGGWAHRQLSFGGRLALIKSTLEAIPVHTFQAIEPTKGALKVLEQQLARFFWGATAERKKTHWIGWDQICLPTSEGGLGVRRFKEVLRAFNIKLWWRFREQNSLWARHMFSKYCNKTSPLVSAASGRCSSTWRRLIKAWPDTHTNIRWMVGSGNVLFWDDIWLGDLPLRELALDERGDPLGRVSDFWSDGIWSRPKLESVQRQTGLPPEVLEDILKVPILRGQQDIPRWCLSQHGNFTLASAWETGRNRGPIIPALEDIWNKGLTASISIFMWRLISNRIPVDEKLQWRKISLASKCLCCSAEPNSESLLHLFVNGRGASGVWREFDKWFAGHGHPLRDRDSIPDRLEIWARRYQQKSPLHLSRLIPCLIFWFLWAERNRCRHNETNFKTSNVTWQVQLHVHKLMAAGCLVSSHWQGVCLPFAVPTQIRVNPLHQFVMKVKWKPPDTPWIKLNTHGGYDGATRKAIGGGIIRNNLGRIILAFSAPLTAQSSLEADFQAMLVGIQIAKEAGGLIWVESEAAQAVAIINSSCAGPANARHALAHIRLCQGQLDLRVSFIHSEGNKPAIRIAALAKNDPILRRYNNGDLPRDIRAMVRTEEEGMPYIRVNDQENDSEL